MNFTLNELRLIRDMMDTGALVPDDQEIFESAIEKIDRQISVLYGRLSWEKFKSAQEFWKNPPCTIGDRLQGFQSTTTRKMDHLDYMDFAELYADYVVEYEKANSKVSNTKSAAAPVCDGIQEWQLRNKA